MPRRAIASAILAATLSLPAAALADVPPADGGGGGGGSASASVNLNCTVSTQSTAGSTCSECVVSSGDSACQTELGSEYSYVCSHSATEQIWCTGPNRNTSIDPGCALGGPPLPALPAAAMTTLLGIAAWARRRRQR